MNAKYTFLGFAAGAALVVATGCGKQEPSSGQSENKATPPPARVATEPQQPAQAPKAAETQPAMPVQTEPAVLPGAAPTNTASAPIVPPPDASAVTQTLRQSPAVALPLAANTNSTGTVTGAMPLLRSSFAQAASNQFQAMGFAATNQALSALGLTNQLAAAATNQVQFLLEKAKILTANQKYQEALATLTQLYNTKLTPEQKQQADALKAKIQTALAEKATSTLGNILGGQKP